MMNCTTVVIKSVISHKILRFQMATLKTFKIKSIELFDNSCEIHDTGNLSDRKISQV